MIERYGTEVPVCSFNFIVEVILVAANPLGYLDGLCRA
jgi:hypothetical protein